MKYGIYRRGSEASAKLSDLVRPGDKTRLDDEFFHAFGVPAPGRTLFEDVLEDEPEVPQPTPWIMALPDEALAADLRTLVRTEVGKCEVDAVSVSGGIDSAAVACILKPKVVFSCTYEGRAYQEIEYARLVAESIGARHVVVSPDAEYAKRVLPLIVEAVGQPIFPSSAVGCWAVCEAAAKEGIRSVADGTGPDELFGGYVRYALVLEEDRLARIPELIDYVPMVKRFWGQHAFEHPAARYYDLLRAGGPDDGAPLRFVHGEFEKSSHLVSGMTRTDLRLGMRGFMAMTAGCSRANGLEWRSPIFSDAVVSAALGLPDHVKIRNGCGKWVFRQAMRGTVPDRILDRTDKKGWVTPVAGWFSGPLEEWADSLRRCLADRGIVPRKDPARGEFDQSTFQDACLELWLRRFGG